MTKEKEKTEIKKIKDIMTENTNAMMLVASFLKRQASEKSFDELITSTNWRISPEVLFEPMRFIGLITLEKKPKTASYYHLGNIYNIILALKDAKIDINNVVMCTPEKSNPALFYVDYKGFVLGFALAPLYSEFTDDELEEMEMNPFDNKED